MVEALLRQVEIEPEGGRLNEALARTVVGIHRVVAGRGPTQCRAFFRHDVIVVVMQGVMTVAERSVASQGRPDDALRIRRALHEAMRGQLTAAVAALTGAQVRAMLAGSRLEPDAAALVFLLDRPVDP